MDNFYSWQTKKNKESYIWSVSQNFKRETPNSNGKYVDIALVAIGHAATRDMAVRNIRQQMKAHKETVA